MEGGYGVPQTSTSKTSTSSQVFGSIGLAAMLLILVFSERLPEKIVAVLMILWVFCGGVVVWNFLRESSSVGVIRSRSSRKLTYLLYADKAMSLSKKAVLLVFVFFILGLKFLLVVSMLIVFICILAWIYFVYKEMRTKL
ncbi:MAG TPA: hypothetical protein PLZ99_00910 [Parcubacteria group bacterium]|nr:hypothetical protein [Parcubacteria group bacterium]